MPQKSLSIMVFLFLAPMLAVFVYQQHHLASTIDPANGYMLYFTADR